MRNPLSVLSHILELEPPRSGQWPRVRAAHLAKEPFCRWCGSVRDLQVHHIIPFAINPARELDPTNLITLCETYGVECHLRHGHFGDWHKFNPNIVAQAIMKGPAKLASFRATGINPRFLSDAITRDLPRAEIFERGLPMRWWAQFTQDLRCQSDIAGSITVPTGFFTDGASIPRIFWRVLQDCDPDILYPAYVHDLLYSLTGNLADGRILTRNDCDQVIRELMLCIGAPLWKADAVYTALKVGGGAAWAQDQKLKAFKLSLTPMKNEYPES